MTGFGIRLQFYHIIGVMIACGVNYLLIGCGCLHMIFAGVIRYIMELVDMCHPVVVSALWLEYPYRCRNDMRYI